MHTSFALLAMATAALAQGVTETITPKSGPPAGCLTTFPGEFEIGTLPLGSSPKRSLVERQQRCNEGPGALRIKLVNGVLTDNQGRIGYIAENRQFQFDGPPQTGAIYTGGFSVCQNNSLALESTVWRRCLSGEFFNLYDINDAPQCETVAIQANSCSGQSPSFSSGAPSVTPSVIPSPSVPMVSITMNSDGEAQEPTGAASVPSVISISSAVSSISSAISSLSSNVTAMSTSSALNATTISSATLTSGATSVTSAPAVPTQSGNSANLVKFELSALLAGAAAFALL